MDESRPEPKEPPETPRFPRVGTRGADRRWSLWVGLASILIASAAAAGWTAIRRRAEQSERSRHTSDVVAEVRGLIATAVDAETGARGFVIVGEDAFLEPYRDALPGIPAHLARLRALTADDALQQRRLRELERAVADRLVLLEELVALRRAGPGAAAIEETIRRGKSAMDDVRARLGEIESEELRRLAERREQTDAASGVLNASLLAGAGAAIALVLLVFVALRREIGRRGRAEDELRSAFESAPDGMVIADGDGRIVFANGETERLFGWTRAELLGRPVDTLVPPRFREAHPRLRAGYVADPKTRPMSLGTSLSGVTKAGAEIPVEISLSPLRTEAGLYVCAAIRDVAERRKTEQERDRFFALSSDLLCVVGTDGWFKMLNPAWARTLGWTREEMLARPWIEFVHPDDRAASQAERERVEGRGESILRFENRYRRRDGTYRWLQWAAVPQTELGLVYARARDVTDERGARLQIEGLNGVLARKNAELEDANKELESFSYSVSHDLRAPLRSIDGFSLALLEDCGDRLDDTGKDHLRRVRAATQRMARLIDDLLGLARVSRAEAAREPVDLSALAEDVVAGLRSAEPARVVDVVVEPGLRVEGDPRLLRVVLENLIGNAWKYTSKKPRARIEFESEAVDGTRAFVVRDDGAGFDMTYAGKLFGVFQRLHGVDEFPGTGVGLATVKRIVRRHGGRLWAEGAVGKGAAFHFTLGGAEAEEAP